MSFEEFAKEWKSAQRIALGAFCTAALAVPIVIVAVDVLEDTTVVKDIVNTQPTHKTTYRP